MLLASEQENPAAASLVCVHCGSPIPAGRQSGANFCCNGCAYVHQLVCAHGLEAFYRIKDRVMPPADGVVLEPRNLDWLGSLQARSETAALSGAPKAVVDVQGISCAAC